MSEGLATRPELADLTKKGSGPNDAPIVGIKEDILAPIPVLFRNKIVLVF